MKLLLTYKCERNKEFKRENRAEIKEYKMLSNLLKKGAQNLRFLFSVRLRAETEAALFVAWEIIQPANNAKRALQAEILFNQTQWRSDQTRRPDCYAEKIQIFKFGFHAI